MNILNYQQLRVSSNPLIISINKRDTIIQGGTKFELQGYNFNLIQRIQVFIQYKSQYFLQNVYKRLSNERLLFKFPSLDSIKSEEGEEGLRASIGFIMDNYNQTLDQVQINYFKIQNLFKIESINLLDNGLNEHVLLIKFKESNELQTKFKPDLDIFILNENLKQCNCDFKLWLNDTYLTCKFNKQNCDSSSTETRKQIVNFIDLVKLSIGNHELLNHDNEVKYENNEILTNYLKQIQLKQTPSPQINLNRVILIITSIILVLLFLILLVIVVYYYKKKIFKVLDYKRGGGGGGGDKMDKLLNKISGVRVRVRVRYIIA
jgi:hypothetical protein